MNSSNRLSVWVPIFVFSVMLLHSGHAGLADEELNTAIDKGVDYLKKQIRVKPTGQHAPGFVDYKDEPLPLAWRAEKSNRRSGLFFWHLYSRFLEKRYTVIRCRLRLQKPKIGTRHRVAALRRQRPPMLRLRRIFWHAFPLEIYEAQVDLRIDVALHGLLIQRP